MANIIIGTAGHIDHGKSTLIKALTGIQTDTTEEEIERGMSINLGFAYFDLPNGKRVGIIDVPGHERFIKNMLAGAQGINMILLVIDANEGVMPQTIEHANILTLLGVEEFIIVLTKSDLVDNELLDLLEEDIREKFQGTPIEKAPLIRVDSISRRGFPELIANIEVVASKVQQRNLTSDPRLNVDRVFSVKGFGTIVTGTLQEGVLKKDDDLMLYTSMVPTKVRNIQVHEKNVDSASAGQRTAINLQGLKVTDVKRGDVLSKEGVFTPTYMVDMKVKVLPDYDRPLKLWDRVRVYVGTKEVMARCVPLGTEIISPGEEGFLQLRLEDEIVCKPGDRIILRSYSPMHTLGGGTVLDPSTVKHRRFDEEVIRRLEAKENSDTDSVILDLINNGEKYLLSKNEILAGVKMEKAEAEEKMAELLKDGSLLEFNESYTSMDRIVEMKEEMTRLLSTYHRNNPLKAGMPKEELKSKMKYMIPGKFFEGILGRTVEIGAVRTGLNTVSMPEFEVVYTKDQERIRKDILDKLRSDGFSPRSLKELTKEKGYREVMDSLMDGEVMRIDPDMVILREYFKKAYDIVIETAEKNGSITLAQLRDALSTSRKYAVAILDFLDAAGVTKRVEDERKLTGKKLSI